MKKVELDKTVWRLGNTEVCVCKQELCFNEPEHTHDFIEMVYISHGSAIHSINGIKYEVKKGDLLFINYKQVHSFIANENLNYYNISINPKIFGETLVNAENAFEMLTLSAFEEFQNEVCRDNPLISFQGNELIKIEFILDEMIREQFAKDMGVDTIIKSYLTILLSYVFRKMASQSIEYKRKYRHIPSEILEYIARHCNEKITLDVLAERCFYNPSYFSRLFKEIYGMTVSEYIQKMRIEKSCYMLKYSLRTVDEIATMVGYEDKTNFYRFFKKQCGVTPAAYRKMHKTK